MYHNYLVYKGPCKMNPFQCTTCGQRSIQKYIIKPHPAIINLVEDKRWRNICKKCAKKEVGSKNKRGWEALHADT